MVYYSYALIEAALANALRAAEVGRSAFAARLRHLRRFGIPKSKPGTGKRVLYTKDDAQQMLVALMLESLGCSPTASCRASHVLAQQGGVVAGRFLALLPNGEALLISEGDVAKLTREQPVFVLLNHRLAASSLDNALAAAAVGSNH